MFTPVFNRLINVLMRLWVAEHVALGHICRQRAIGPREIGNRKRGGGFRFDCIHGGRCTRDLVFFWHVASPVDFGTTILPPRRS